MPGIFAMAMLFGLESTMTAVNADAAKGVTDRFRSLPISSAAVVLGRCIADMIHSVVGLVVLVVTGLLLGWRWTNGLAAALAAFGLLMLLRFALLWVGIFIGLKAQGPESVVGRADPGLAGQHAVQPVRRPGDHAGLAGRHRVGQSAVRDRIGDQGTVRQSRLERRQLGWRSTLCCWPSPGRS